MSLKNFLEKFIIDVQTPGYTFLETLVYSIALFFSLLAVFKVIKLLKISIDKKLALAIAPYIALGSLLRLVRDLGIFTSAALMTPWIYFLIFFLLFISFSISLFLQIKFGILIFKPLFLVGVILLSIPLALLTSVKSMNFEGMALVLILFLPWTALFKLVSWSKENKIVSSIQLFDGTVTSVAISFFGYGEQHWLPILIISTFGPFSFVFVKFLAIVTILIALDRLCKEKELRNYVKLIIGILGAATGIRDFTCLATFCIPH